MKLLLLLAPADSKLCQSFMPLQDVTQFCHLLQGEEVSMGYLEDIYGSNCNILYTFYQITNEDVATLKNSPSYYVYDCASGLASID